MSDKSIIQVREMVAHNPRLDQDLIAVIQKFRDDEQVKCLLDISRVLLTACYLPLLICAGAPGHGAGARGGERASLRLADHRHPLRLQKRDPGVGEDLRTGQQTEILIY